MKKVLFVSLAALVFVACGGNTSKNDVQSIEVVETDSVDILHNAANSLDYEGKYVGVLPAADGPGIEVTLTLDNDRNYKMHEKYIDRETEFDSQGIYEVVENLLIMSSDANDTIYYKVEEGRLRRLDRERQPIVGDLAKNYILIKQQ